jgi:hypothetical protein
MYTTLHSIGQLQSVANVRKAFGSILGNNFSIPLSVALVALWLRHYATNRKVLGSIPDEVMFSIYLIPPAALGPGVYSASNRNEYRKHKNNNVSGE